MAEARTDVPEIYKQPYTPEESLYHLAPGVGNSRISEALTLFQKEGMKSPEAMRQLFSLFEALPTSEDEDSGLYRTREGVKPRHSWDQLEWVYTHQKELTSAQRESLILLPRFALDSLAHEQMVITAKGRKRTLSPDAKGTAEEVFQAYDRYIANVFDPELPDWRVPGKAAMGFVAIATALAACGPATPSHPTEIASPTVVATQTYTPTETNTPTVTKTPTEANTPTETKIPVPEYFKGVAPDLASFTLVTPEQEKLILADIMAHPELTKPTTHHIRLDTDGTGGEAIGCYYGENCVVRASIREKNPFGGPDLWKFIFEFRGNDGSHRFMTMYIGGSYKNIIERGAMRRLTDLQGVQQGQHLNIDICSKIDGKESDDNPYTWSITNGAPKEDQTILRALEKNQTSLPDGVETITVQATMFAPTT